MDRKLKERLIGAAVLVGIGVWLIPWILDGPPPAPDAAESPALELALPAASSGEPLRRRTIELEAPARGGASAGERAAPSREAATAAVKPVETPAAPTPGAAEGSGTSRASAPAAAQSRAAPTPAATQPAAAAESAWMVQLGSFGDETNARRLAERVETFGHEARIFPFAAGGRQMYRVRVGSFTTRARAEAAASALSAHGFAAQVVAPE